MRRLSNILVISVFWSGVYGLSQFALSYFSEIHQDLSNAMTPRELANPNLQWGRLLPFVNLPDGSILTVDTVIDPIFGLVFALYLFSLFYSRQWFKSTMQKVYGRLGLLIGLCLVAVGATFSHHLLRSSLLPYKHICHPSPLSVGRLSQVDTSYGYTLLPFARTFQMAPPADPIPGFTNGDGFRVLPEQVRQSSATGKVDILFLGCSFTFGALCKADSIFPHLSSQALGFRYINAGVSGWGLAQMQRRAKELIPKYKPRYVVFQYSYWLPQRAAGTYRHVFDYPLPKPYYDVLPSGAFALSKPPFTSRVFEFDTDSAMHRYQGHPIRYLLQSGVPSKVLSDDIQRFQVWWQRLTGRIHPVTTAPEQMEALSRQVYTELLGLSRENGSVPLILHLSPQHQVFEPYPSFLSPADTSLYIDGMAWHKKYLKENPSASMNIEFMHWRIHHGDTVIVDQHPNHLSHHLISQSIAARVRRMEEKLK